MIRVFISMSIINNLKDKKNVLFQLLGLKRWHLTLILFSENVFRSHIQIKAQDKACLVFLLLSLFSLFPMLRWT